MKIPRTFFGAHFYNAPISLMLIGLILLTLGACSDKNKDEPVIDDDDQIEFEEEAPEIVSNGALCTLKTADIAMDIPEYIRSQIDSRFSNISSSLDANTKVVLASTSQLSSDDSRLYDAYKNGATLVFIDTDKAQLLNWLDKYGLTYADDRDDFEDLHMVYAFNNRDYYLLFDDFVESDVEEELAVLPYRFDSVIDWLNEFAIEESLSNGDSDGVYDVRTTFGKQVIRHTYAVSLIDKTIASVMWAEKDKLTKSSSIDITFTVYPLYSDPKDGDSSGDYYIVQGFINAHNAGMYNGKWVKRHGGVYARLCGFYMKELNFYASLNAEGKQVTFPIGGTPVPASSQSSSTYSSGFSWSIGGHITGKADSSGVGAEVGVTASATWNNSETRELPDVTIRRDTQGGNVNWCYSVNNLPHKTGAGLTMSLDIPDVAVSDLEVKNTWIWWVPGTEKTDDRNFKAKIRVEPVYASYHWYSSGADFAEYTWPDGVSDKSKEFEVPLCHPVRNLKID